MDERSWIMDVSDEDPRFWIMDVSDEDGNANVDGWWGIVDEREGGIVAYVGTLELAQLIGDALKMRPDYGTSNDKPWCNHDAAALTPMEANLCECGALVPPLPDED